MKSQEIHVRLFRGATFLERIAPPSPRGCPREILTQKFQMDRFRKGMKKDFIDTLYIPVCQNVCKAKHNVYNLT